MQGRNGRILAALVTLILLAAAPATQASFHDGPHPHERALLVDVADDYRASSALDLTALYLVERYRFDFERVQPIGDTLSFRFEAADLGSLSTGITARFHVFFTGGGSVRHAWADVTQQEAGVKALAQSSGATAATSGTSVLLLVPYTVAGVKVGESITGIWAATSLAAGTGRQIQDLLPGDGLGAPAGGDPAEATTPTGAASTTVEGPYPFARLEAASPTTLLSALGREVRFEFLVHPGPGVQGEFVRFYFEVPPGWTVEPSQGKGTGADAVGELTNWGARGTSSFAVTASSLAGAAPNDTAEFGMQMVTSSGAHETWNLSVRVTDALYDSPDYVFTLLSQPTTKAGQSMPVRVRIGLANGSDLPPVGRVLAEARQGGITVDSIQLDGPVAETWNGSIVFDAEGPGELVVYMASLEPSPHAVFEISVGGSGLAPGPGVATLLAVLGLGLAWRRNIAPRDKKA